MNILPYICFIYVIYIFLTLKAKSSNVIVSDIVIAEWWDSPLMADSSTSGEDKHHLLSVCYLSVFHIYIVIVSKWGRRIDLEVFSCVPSRHVQLWHLAVHTFPVTTLASIDLDNCTESYWALLIFSWLIWTLNVICVWFGSVFSPEVIKTNLISSSWFLQWSL